MDPCAQSLFMKHALTCTTLMILCAATMASAQTPAADTGYTATAAQQLELREAVRRRVGREDAGRAATAFKPTPEVRSFGELIGHLANEHYLLCSPLKGEANPMAKVDFEKTTAKADLVKAINDSNAYCDAAYGVDERRGRRPITSFSETRRDTPFRVMLLNVTHDNEHYGNIITYLRMKGIVPPSSTPTRLSNRTAET